MTDTTADPRYFQVAVELALEALKDVDRLHSTKKNPETGWRNNELCDAYQRLHAAPEMLKILLHLRNSYPGYIPDFVEAINAVIDKTTAAP